MANIQSHMPATMLSGLRAPSYSSNNLIITLVLQMKQLSLRKTLSQLLCWWENPALYEALTHFCFPIEAL